MSNLLLLNAVYVRFLFLSCRNDVFRIVSVLRQRVIVLIKSVFVIFKNSNFEKTSTVEFKFFSIVPRSMPNNDIIKRSTFISVKQLHHEVICLFRRFIIRSSSGYHDIHKVGKDLPN